MNLQEDIDRIKEVMRINEETIDPYLKRRFPEILDAVLQAAKWYNPKMMPDFNTFLDRAVYSGIISVVSDNFLDQNVKQANELETTIIQMIYDNKNLLGKFKDIFYEGMYDPSR